MTRKSRPVRVFPGTLPGSVGKDAFFTPLSHSIGIFEKESHCVALCGMEHPKDIERQTHGGFEPPLASLLGLKQPKKDKRSHYKGRENKRQGLPDVIQV